MSGQIQKEVIKEKTLSDKMHLMADTLRNAKIKQCKGKFYDPKNDSMCAYGVLGFMAGIPKEELKRNRFSQVLKEYDLDLEESMLAVNLPDRVDYPERKTSLFMSIFQMNDKGYTFTEVADQLDVWADNL